MNSLTLIRQARDRLTKAYDLSQKPECKSDAETLLIDACNEINRAIIELRKDRGIE